MKLFARNELRGTICNAGENFMKHPVHTTETWKTTTRTVHTSSTLRSIRKRARNIALRVNKYFSNRRVPGANALQPLSLSFSLILLLSLLLLFPFSSFLFDERDTHGEADLFDAIPTIHRIHGRNILPGT